MVDGRVLNPQLPNELQLGLTHLCLHSRARLEVSAAPAMSAVGMK
jgi:hypothetical protein